MKKAIIKSILIFCVTLLTAARITYFGVIAYRNANLPETTAKTQNTILKLSQIYTKPQNAIRIMTYNILSDEPGFEGSPAYTRAKGVCEIINNFSLDVIGVQEMSRSWFYYLKSNTQYNFVSPIKTAITFSKTALLYNPQKLILKTSGEKALSKGTYQQLRKYIWATFETIDKKITFTVVNTHFSLNKNNSFTPLLQAFDLIDFSKNFHQKHPIFFIGDFNTTQTTNKNNSICTAYETLSTVFTDAKTISKSLSEGTEKSSKDLFVDHIFLKGDVEISNFVILSNKELAFFSDHYPLLTDVIINF